MKTKTTILIAFFSLFVTTCVFAQVSNQCGNGILQTDHSEQCDGTNFGHQSCKSLGFSGGTLSCSETCSLDTSQCTQKEAKRSSPESQSGN